MTPVIHSPYAYCGPDGRMKLLFEKNNRLQSAHAALQSFPDTKPVQKLSLDANVKVDQKKDRR